LWWNSESGQLKIYYTDVDSSQWVDAAAGAADQTLSLGELTGVDLTTPSSGEILQYDGVDWVNATIASDSDKIEEGNSSVEVVDAGTGKIEFTVDAVEIADFTASAVVFNESGADVDFRIESDTDANAFFLDGATGDVSIGQNLKFNSGYGSVATAYGCRAWVNFNGEGTLTILESGNVSSVTDNGIGKYTVNFTTAMPDADYSATGIAAYNGGGFNDPAVIGQDNTTSNSTSSFPFYTFRINVGIADSLPCMLAFFR